MVRRALANGAQRPGFRLIEFSVQSNHIHMLCEGKDRVGLSRGIQGLLIRIARAVNRHLGRRGRVFGDRYHDRILRTPSEVRNALAYVLNNHRRHAAQRGKSFSDTYIDRCSSAPAFYGAGRAPVTLPNPHSWLLTKGWKRAGPVRLWEIPGGRGT